MPMTPQEGVRALEEKVKRLRQLNVDGNALAAARKECETLARGAQRASTGRAPLATQVIAGEKKVTVRLRGPLVPAMMPALRRQRDAGVRAVREAVLQEIKERR